MSQNFIFDIEESLTNETEDDLKNRQDKFYFRYLKFREFIDRMHRGSHEEKRVLGIAIFALLFVMVLNFIGFCVLKYDDFTVLVIILILTVSISLPVCIYFVGVIKSNNP
ncbi:hypothetical protein NPIL_517501 [Nephila pilipes]|uniref:Uncharacterized protein n=1 Tax=Nephila pilipes TaxID=299642 RepID=A0A8X6QTK2_NEPPI|nr:hypothetical protein NPIL_517501 [Nephila pilipes]